jgi:hypothetical protein
MSSLKRGSSGNDVRSLQTVFGYDVDGVVGPATHKLIEQQLGYGWNLQEARKAYVKPQS